MKKLFILLSLACMGLAVSSCYDDSELWESVNGLESRVKTLETLCSEMNTNISSLQDLATAVQKGGYITEVTPLTENGVEVGYKVTLNDGRMVTIYHGKNGSAGNASQIGVKQDSDGKYYWVVGGEWIKDDKGNKVPVSSGTTPKIKVENGKWYVSYDGGTTWEELGAATASDTCLFDDVTYTNGVLTLKFADGNVLSFPIGDTFRIVLGDFDLTWGYKWEIPYTIKGATGEVIVLGMFNEWEELVLAEIVEETAYSGKIIVDTYGFSKEEFAGRIIIMASDESGTTVTKLLKFVQGVMYTEDDKDYIIDAEGGQLSLKVTTNRTFKVNTNADWITYVETKAVEEKTLLFDVEANEGKARQTEIEVVSGDRKLVFPVVQKTGGGSVFSVDLEWNEVLGGLSKVDFTADLYYANGDALKKPVNRSGLSLHEFLGYDTWEELAQAIGDQWTVKDFSGEVIITAYDPETGESFGKVPYNYNSYSPSYYLDKDGKIVDASSDWRIRFYWYFGSSYISPQFQFDLRYPIYAGETYRFGILLSSYLAEAYIDVNIKVTEYIDPEKGLYDTPKESGTYTFDLNTEIEVPEWDNSGNWWLNQGKVSVVHDIDVVEEIKETLGMTSYELYRNSDEFESYLVLSDESKYNGSVRLDADGVSVNDLNYVVEVQWFYTHYDPSYNELQLSVPINWPSSGSPDGWGTEVIEALENNKEITYKYVIEYKEYELVFNHTIKFKWAESAE